MPPTGGPRKGAGRPSDGEHRPVVVSVPMTEAAAAALDAYCVRRGLRSRAAGVRSLVADEDHRVGATSGARIIDDPSEAPTDPGDAGDDTP